MIKAYPQLNRAPEYFGFHRMCFEVGVMVGFLLFHTTKNPLASAIAAFCMMCLINYFLKKDPKFFQILRKAKKVPAAGIGFFKPEGESLRRVRIYAGP